MKNSIIVLAQLNLKIGDIKANTQKMLAAIDEAKTSLHADLIIFPELAITSYPPEDLLLRSELYPYVNESLALLAKKSLGIDVIVGYPALINGSRFNAAAWLSQGKVEHVYYKRMLPNYGVFDEERYFTKGQEHLEVDWRGNKIALFICEDIWHPEPWSSIQSADLAIVINASPYTTTKATERETILHERLKEKSCPVIYVNLVGGQDDLLFDGSSFACNAKGEVMMQAPSFIEGLYPIVWDSKEKTILPEKMKKEDSLAILYQGLVMSVRDYIEKNRFPGVIIGLSGGIDSALTLAIAVDALGPDRVSAVMMPTVYTASMSQEDAESEAKKLGVPYHVAPIQNLFNSFLDELNPFFKNHSIDKTEENLQARIRGMLLMALSNKTGNLVLTTSNKSEMAVGYSTLYGDMAGGFCVLKDVYKTEVYQLAKYRNSISHVIPDRVITRAPSAELAPNQKDQDSLPSYDILDAIIKAVVEERLDGESIIKNGFDSSTVEHVIRLLYLNEYKRRQSPVGPRISSCAFSREWRYPITSGWLECINLKK